MHTLHTCRSNNPVLLSFIQSLTLHLDKPLVQRLIISTVAACPDLLLPYMRTLPFSLEPRLSSKWVNSVDFIVKVIGLWLTDSVKVDGLVESQVERHYE